MNKIFSIKRLLDYFKSDVQTSLKGKMLSLEELFEQWKSNAEQDEDVFVLAVKLK